MLGAFTPFYRNHNSADSISQEYYLWDTVTEAAKKFGGLRQRLIDYMYTSLWRQSEDGTPSLFPIWFKYPSDPNTFGIETQYFYGDALMIAPVLMENSTSVDVYLPKDIFYKFWTGNKVMGEGGDITMMDQGLTDMPLFIAGGNIVPLRIETEMTTTEVRMKDFELIIAPDLEGKASGMLYLDDGESLVQNGTTLIRFEYANDYLSTSGHYQYPTTRKIVKVVTLGFDMELSRRHGRAIKYKDDGTTQLSVETDLSLSEAFSTKIF